MATKRGRPPKAADERMVATNFKFPPRMLRELRKRALAARMPWQTYTKQLIALELQR